MTAEQGGAVATLRGLSSAVPGFDLKATLAKLLERDNISVTALRELLALVGD